MYVECLSSTFRFCREEAVQTGGFEGNGRHFIRDEQLHHATVPKTGVGGVFS